MPLNAPPLRGYTDEQRVTNYDTGLIFSSTGPTDPFVTSGVEDVSRYGYLSGRFVPTSNYTEVSYTWYLDAAATITTGGRSFMLSNQIVEQGYVTVANQGPFVQIQLSGTTGPTSNLVADIFASNRVPLVESPSVLPVTIDQQAVAIAANGTNTVYPFGYYTGPISVFYAPAYATGSLDLQWLSTAGTWDLVNQVVNNAAGQFTPTWIAPVGAWRIVVSNATAGGSSYYLALTPSSSGAS